MLVINSEVYLTNHFWCKILIKRKFPFVFIQIVSKWWPQNFPHVTTAVLLLVVIWWPCIEIQQTLTATGFEFWANLEWNDPPEWYPIMAPPPYVSHKPFCSWSQDIPGELCQNHGCWCHGSCHHQAISSHAFDHIWYTDPCHPPGKNLTICAISGLRNHRKCKYIFYIS